jgi:hypothetical protein
MTPAPTSDRLHCGRERPEPLLQPLECGVTTVLGIDVEYDQIRDLTRDDPDIGIRPAPKPFGDVVFGRPLMLQIVPTNEGSFIARAERQH